MVTESSYTSMCPTFGVRNRSASLRWGHWNCSNRGKSEIIISSQSQGGVKQLATCCKFTAMASRADLVDSERAEKVIAVAREDSASLRRSVRVFSACAGMPALGQK